MIITLFGDSMAAHGNALWLGSLIQALQPLGLNARQIRTAVFRLTQDNWLSCTKIGRRSYYSFTDFGFRQYAQSARRVYVADSLEWDGEWTLVLPSFVGPDIRDQLKRQLTWLGFGSIGSGVMAHPCANQASLKDTLAGLEISDATIVFKATTDQLGSRSALQRLTEESWGLKELEIRYAEFVSVFAPLLECIIDAEGLDAGQMFEFQTVLVHEYRRIILKTTDLPDELLPANWPGREALEVMAQIYRASRPLSAQFIEATFEGPRGALEKAGPDYFQRFGSD